MTETTLLKDLREAEQAVVDFSQARSQGDEARDMRTVTEDLDKTVDSVERVLAAFVVARKGGFDPDLPEASRLLREWTGLHATATAAVTLKERQVARKAIDRALPDLKVLSRTLEPELRAHWLTRISDTVDLQGVEALLRALEGPSTSSAVGKIKGYVGELKKMGESLPREQDLARLTEIGQQWPAVLRDLVGSDPEIRAFISKAGSCGAALDQLSPTVREWLNAKGLASQFRIVARGGQL